jgi:hypothetical protein
MNDEKVKENIIKLELAKTTYDVGYNGWNNNRTNYGYHSYNIENINIIGQRSPKIRIDNFKNSLNLLRKMF